ncbi:MAG: metallopeptidase TldD-related protein [Planctomycetota bacterium]
MKVLAVLLCASLSGGADKPTSEATANPSHPLVSYLAGELDYSMANLKTDEGTKPYYIAYTITDVKSVAVSARLGALYRSDDDHGRVLDVDVRVGDYELDSTHQIRGGRGRITRGFGGGARSVSVEDNPAAIHHALWLSTDSAFQRAVQRYQRVKTNMKTMVEEEGRADDFSREDPSVYAEEPVAVELDRKAWEGLVRRVSKLGLKYPLIYTSSVSISGTAENRYMATSEGTRLQTGRELWRVAVSASTKADDGMELSQSHLFSASSEGKLPSEEAVLAAFQGVIDQALALREAPVVEPYTGPAILLNRASGVFFHEIFGHRIEGHRQKSVEEGQTFTKMVGKSVLPDFLSVIDDPTRKEVAGVDLRGHYRYDDEGVLGSRVDLVKSGILQTFLLSRSPVANFKKSNGHGRREPGRAVVSRQGNLIVESTKSVPFATLREQLIAECKRQEKPYGFLFEDITGGFTTTGRGGPQAFKVLPVVVYRIYADGRPDELVRGVDIVGTPLSCFSRIMATGDDPAVFNGSCGAESGWVPVSAVSPSILVEQIEIEKRERSQDRLPILSPPIAVGDDETKDATRKPSADQEEL